MAKRIETASDLDQHDPQTSMIARPGTVRLSNPKAQHTTPGPWQFRFGSSFRIIGPNGYDVLMFSDDNRAIPSTTDARLIAAAPELLAALIRAQKALNDEGYFNEGRSCQAAITKATV